MKYSIGNYFERSPDGTRPTRNDGSQARMKAIVGLGNPGSQYAGTRHNVGFMVVARLAELYHAPSPKNRFKSLVTEITLEGQQIVLVQPQTYMNLSGDAVRLAMNWYKLDANDTLIVLDEIDLPFATIRLRERGSAGGHNGLASVIQQVGTNDIPRLRIGIGRGRSHATAHVLSRFADEERAELPELIGRAAEACRVWATEGALAAMNRANSGLIAHQFIEVGGQDGE